MGTLLSKVWLSSLLIFEALIMASKFIPVKKTKKTPGVITKINQKKCLVKMDGAIGTIYQVPFQMLEAA